MASIRDHFPIFKSKIYMNSCSQGALSVEVKEAYANYLRDWDEKGAPWEYWGDRNEAARQAFAGLVNAEANEIAVTTSLSAGVSALASALDFSGERNKVVISDFEFPTVAQIWHAQEARGAQVVHVPAAGNIIPLSRFADAIDEQTLIVSISHVCFRNGTMLDIAAIIEMAHAKGALVLVDSYQALGTTPIDVKKLKVDFLAGGVLKYLLASAGLAYLYVRKELLSDLKPTAMGWFSQANIFAMDIYANTPHPTARRFESGTPPVPNTYAAVAGIKLVQSVGVENIERQLKVLTGALKEGIMKRGFNLVTPADPAKHGAMITVRSHKVDLLTKWLGNDGIIVSHRDDNLRISPHFYNDLHDVDCVMDGLSKYRELLV
ncbi:MAG: aminotransferase class V-fold PLP-dependent enzyme [Chloroflexi bacterium]|nr:aminotransferase class V-fold PLP-dependent enzyme [Chloroflexota bacterium]MCC6895813.1 aminotransferase class V-fold PLP-dependent enzyme [Anaerolineae bacterium]